MAESRSGKQQKFVTALTADGICFAYKLTQAPGYADEQLVAYAVTQRVVEGLEAVYVDHQQGHHAAALVGKGDGLLQPILEQLMVGQPGQGIVVGEKERLLFGQLQLVQIIDHPDAALLRMVEVEVEGASGQFAENGAALCLEQQGLGRELLATLKGAGCLQIEVVKGLIGFKQGAGTTPYQLAGTIAQYLFEAPVTGDNHMLAHIDDPHQRIILQRCLLGEQGGEHLLVALALGNIPSHHHAVVVPLQAGEAEGEFQPDKPLFIAKAGDEGMIPGRSATLVKEHLPVQPLQHPEGILAKTQGGKGLAD